MFGKGIEKAASSNGGLIPGQLSTAQPQNGEYGVSSAVNDLIEEVKCVASLSLELKSVLGIAPPPDSKGEAVLGESLVTALRFALQVLATSCVNITDSIKHLRS